MTDVVMKQCFIVALVPLTSYECPIKSKERLARIELAIPGWKAGVIPFHYRRTKILDCLHHWKDNAAGLLQNSHKR